MKIGIDVDRVIIDYEKGLLTIAELFDMEKCRGNGKIHPNEFRVQDRYDWTEEEKKRFLNEDFQKVSAEASIMPGAKYVLQKLKEMGYELILISARGKDEENTVDIITEKFKKENIKVDKCYWKKREKLAVCQAENISLMIDDKPTTCQTMAENQIKTLYFRGIRGWNLEENEYLKEVSNWGEVYRYVVKECGENG